MKTKKFFQFVFLCTVVMVAGAGCIVVDWLQSKFQNEGIIEQSPFPSESQPEQPTVQTVDQPEREQIVFVSADGNIWRYILDSGEILQVTDDGFDEYEGRYTFPHLSPGGHFVAYYKAGTSYIHVFEDGRVIDLTNEGQFFNWTDQEGQFFVFKGDQDCDSLADISEQTQLNYDVLRYTIDSLSTPEFIANISGGMQIAQEITPDGVYAAFRKCYCYSECGGASLWHLPSATVLSGPDGSDYGNISFSADFTQLAVTSFEPHLYESGELYVANIDFTHAKEIYKEPNKVPFNPLWSPDEGWIAFTVVYFGGEDESEIYSQPLIIKPDGSDLLVIDENYSEVIDWSPDGQDLLYLKRGEPANQVFIYHVADGSKTLLPIVVGDYGTMAWGRLP